MVSFPQDLYFTTSVPVLQGPFNGTGLYQVIEEDLATRERSFKAGPRSLLEAKALAASLNARHYTANPQGTNQSPAGYQVVDDDVPFLAMVVPYDPAGYVSASKQNHK